MAVPVNKSIPDPAPLIECLGASVVDPLLDRTELFQKLLDSYLLVLTRSPAEGGPAVGWRTVESNAPLELKVFANPEGEGTVLFAFTGEEVMGKFLADANKTDAAWQAIPARHLFRKIVTKLPELVVVDPGVSHETILDPDEVKALGQGKIPETANLKALLARLRGGDDAARKSLARFIASGRGYVPGQARGVHADEEGPAAEVPPGTEMTFYMISDKDGFEVLPVFLDGVSLATFTASQKLADARGRSSAVHVTRQVLDQVLDSDLVKGVSVNALGEESVFLEKNDFPGP